MSDVKLWCLTFSASSIPVLARILQPDATGHSPLEVANYGEVHRHLIQVFEAMKDHEDWQINALGFRTGPEHVLRIDDPSFVLDYFVLRESYASARLRAAFALRPDEIAYRAVNTSRCGEAARAKDYEMFLPLKVADPFDPARMPGRVRPVRQEDGSLRDKWVVEFPMPHPSTPATAVHFKPGFIPPAPLFTPLGASGWMFATEELADRVTRAGVTGIAFREIEGVRAASEMIYRTPG